VKTEPRNRDGLSTTPVEPLDCGYDVYTEPDVYSDLQLAPGERVRQVEVHDPKSWRVMPVEVGAVGAGRQYLLFASSSVAGGHSFAVVGTNRGIYRITLHSAKGKGAVRLVPCEPSQSRPIQPSSLDS
jgi:hypothetical protein